LKFNLDGAMIFSGDSMTPRINPGSDESIRIPPEARARNKTLDFSDFFEHSLSIFKSGCKPDLSESEVAGLSRMILTKDQNG